MPAKKTETKDTVTKKGTKPVETKATKTTARTKTTKKAEPKAKETVKKAAKTKQTVKKTETLKDDKTSVEAVKDDKVKETKKTTAKKAPAKKTTTKKTTTKKTTAAKTAKKSTTKKTDTKQKMEQYNQFSLDTCIDMAKAMGIDMGYDQYAQLLMDQSDTKEIVKTILEQYPIKADAFSYEEDGYDLDLLEVLVTKVAQTVTIKASDYAAMGKEIEAHEAYVISEESLDNNDEYNADFDLVRRLLMIAQRKDIHTMSDLQTIVTADATKLIEKFMECCLCRIKKLAIR